MQQTELEPFTHAVLGQQSASPLEELPSECTPDLPAGPPVEPSAEQPLELPLPQPASPERVASTGQHDGTMADELVSALDPLSCCRNLSVLMISYGPWSWLQHSLLNNIEFPHRCGLVLTPLLHFSGMHCCHCRLLEFIVRVFKCSSTLL